MEFSISVNWFALMHQRFTCDRCGRSYKHKSNLSNHKREECGKPPSYFCPICSKGFKKKQHMQRHLTVHSNSSLPPSLVPNSPLGLDQKVFGYPLPQVVMGGENQMSREIKESLEATFKLFNPPPAPPAPPGNSSL